MQVEKGGEKKAEWEEGLIRGHVIKKSWGPIQYCKAVILQLNISKFLKRTFGGDFPHGPVGKTWSSQCRGSIPGQDLDRMCRN